MPSMINFGGGSSEGNAVPTDVLDGVIFSNDDDTGLTGTMPNKGTHQPASEVGGGSNSLYAYIPYGYYSEYTGKPGKAWIDLTNDQARDLANNAGVGYNSGRNQGHSDAQGNPGAYGLEAGGSYNRGVTDADNRSNPDSANYKSGYTSGYGTGRTQGQNDAKANPGTYGLETGGSYNRGYNAGVTAADNRANSNSTNYKTGYSNGQNSTGIVNYYMGASFYQSTINQNINLRTNSAYVELIFAGGYGDGEGVIPDSQDDSSVRITCSGAGKSQVLITPRYASGGNDATKFRNQTVIYKLTNCNGRTLNLYHTGFKLFNGLVWCTIIVYGFN